MCEQSAAPRAKWAVQSVLDIAALPTATRSEEHTSELQSRSDLVCRLLLEKKKNTPTYKATRQLAAGNLMAALKLESNGNVSAGGLGEDLRIETSDTRDLADVKLADQDT